MINIADRPEIKALQDGKGQVAEPTTASQGEVATQVPAYPSKILVLEEGVYRVAFPASE